MVWILAVMLVAAYFLGTYTFQLAGVIALIALFAAVVVIGLGMRGMEREDI
jgi:hypothetical protein